MGQTIVEKIFRDHVGRPVRPGGVVVSPIDFVFSHDGNRPQPLQTFAEFGGRRVFDSSKVAMFLDHAPNVHTTAVAELHQQMRKFAADQRVTLYEVGRGISHQVLPEEGHAVPGRIIVGSDSHSCTGGAFNLLSTGVGSADLAIAMMLGKLWFKVPYTIRFVCNGELRAGVYSKDLAMYLLGLMGADGATYHAVEFVGSAISRMSMEARMSITNMAIEMGAKFGVMEADSITREYLDAHGVHDYKSYRSDETADFLATHQIDTAALTPQVAVPPNPDRVHPISDVAGTPIAQATIGTCANGQLDDLRAAASVLEGRRIAPGVRLFVAAASRHAYVAALVEGLVETFLSAGAIWGTPGCSGCTGASGFGVPANGENMITSAQRNFVGRTGNPSAAIYLASPATVAASAIEGAITDPTPYIPVGCPGSSALSGTGGGQR